MTADAPSPGQLAAAIAGAWHRLPGELPRATLERALEPAPPAGALDALLASGRLRGRLGERVAARLGLEAPPPASFDHPADRLVLHGRAAAEEAMRLAGVIRHGAAIGRLVLRRDRERVAEAVGRAAFDLALGHRGGGGGDAMAAAAAEPGADALIDACRRMGPTCMAAWITVLPAGLAGWLAALLPAAAALVPMGGDVRNVESARNGALAVLAQRHV